MAVVAGKGNWGEDESGVREREKRSKKWEKGDRLLPADELSAFPSNSLPSDNTPSPWDGTQSSADGFPGLAGGDFFSTALQTLVGPPDPRSGFNPSSPLPSSADGTERSMAQNNLFRWSMVVSSRRGISRRREINELTIQVAVASVGGIISPPGVSSLEGALRQAEGDGGPQAEQADLVRMWGVWGRVVAV